MRRRSSKCALRDARKKFRATALALPVASFQLGQMLGQYWVPKFLHAADEPTYIRVDGITIGGGGRPWSAAQQPDATPAPVSKGAARAARSMPAPGACHVDAQALLGLSPAAAAAHSCR